MGRTDHQGSSMRRELIIKSKRLAGTSDLTLLAPIKPGLVPSLDSVTHKTRIKRLLQTLGAGRSSLQEYALLRPFSDAVERVGKIHSVRVTVVEPENKVLLAVTFDGTWEAYIRVLWQKVGTLLDIIFFDTVGYVSAYDHRFEEWEAWARRVQIETHFFYSTPYLTVGDVAYLRHQERCHREGRPDADILATRFATPTPENLTWTTAAKTSARPTLDALKQGLEALAALYRLADLYLPSTEDGLFLQRAARDLLLEFVRLLEGNEFPRQLVDFAHLRFDKQLAWIGKPVPSAKDPRRAAPPLPDTYPVFDAADVQGGILRPIDGATHAVLMLLAIDDPGQAVGFFRYLIDHVTREDTGLVPGDVAVSAAISYEGLRVAGLTEDELALFPEEFREGMEARCSMLGDVRMNHPRRWRLPRPAKGEPPIEMASVHAVLHLRYLGFGLGHEMLADPPAFREAVQEWQRQLDAGMRLLAVETMQRRWKNGNIVEHFGFADGGSDPTVAPVLDAESYRNQIHLGEVLVGYANEADWEPEPERAEKPEEERERLEWLRNGSFLVVRKLSQNVDAFEELLRRESARLNLEPETIASKMMGRTKAGQALATRHPGNDFNYQNDKLGQACPFHAHIRRANPRTPSGPDEPVGRRTPRIVRRGMSYGERNGGEEGHGECGLLFMAYNADIGEQFEVIQRWISGGNSSGGFSGQSDPFLGVPEIGCPRSFRFEVSGQQAEQEKPELETSAIASPSADASSTADEVASSGASALRTDAWSAVGASDEFKAWTELGASLHASASPKSEPSPMSSHPSSARACPHASGSSPARTLVTTPTEPESRVVSIALDAEVGPLSDPEPLVRLEWGTYLFTPSIATLRRLRDRLSQHRIGPEPVWSADEGRTLLDRTRVLEAAAPQEAKSEPWKTALEDSIEIEKFRSASVWAAIREQHGGILSTPYGILVADRDLALEVLRNGTKYSVRGYRERLEKSIGSIYLGNDEELSEQRLPVNNAIMQITREEGFAAAHEFTTSVLANFLTIASRYNVNPAQPDNWELTVEIKEIIDRVLGELCCRWFHLPDAASKGADPDIKLEGSRWDADLHIALFPGHFTAPSRFVFQPDPGEQAKKYGCDYGRTLISGFGRFLARATAAETWPEPAADANDVPAPAQSAKPREPLSRAIWRAASGDLDQATRTLVGTMMGMLPTIDGNLRRTLNEWLYEGTFWALRPRWRAEAGNAAAAGGALFKKAREILEPVLIRTMQLRPTPELVWRTATADHMLGGTEVKAGSRVVVSLVSTGHQCLAARNPEYAMLFGGERGSKDAPMHACPGREAAMGVMLGFIAALLEVKEEMRPSAVPLALTLEGQLLPKNGSREPPEDPAELAAARATEARNRQRWERVLSEAKRPDSAPALPSRSLPGANSGRRPLLIGIGDSWFSYFAMDIFDVLSEQHDYEAVSLAAEGTALLEMKANPIQQLRLDALLSQCAQRGVFPSGILISAGGNDVIRSQLAALLRPPPLEGLPESLLDKEAVDAFVDGTMKDALRELIGQIAVCCELRLGSRVPIFVHGYAFPYPDGRGLLGTVDALGEGMAAWLRPGFAEAGYTGAALEAPAQMAMKELILRLNGMQEKVTAEMDATHIDLTDTFPFPSQSYTEYWANELHPTATGFVTLASKVATEIGKKLGAVPRSTVQP